MANRYTLIIIFLLLTIANTFIYINRKDGFEYVQQSAYNDLYPNTTHGIETIAIEKDSIAAINLKGYSPSLKWAVSCSESVIIQNQSLPLHFSLKQKVNRYVLSANDSLIKPVLIDIDYSPSALYKINSSSIATNYEIRYSSEPFITPDKALLSKWEDPLDYIAKPEINEVREIITDSLHIKPADSTVKKIKIIGNYIYQSIKDNIGIPADSLLEYSIYDQFFLAKKCNAKIWCGQITDIFHLFASNAGILCRKIGLTGKRNEFALGDHAFNECYIPETGEWVYVDLTQNILLLEDASKHLLNTVNLYQLKKLNQTAGITVYSSGDSSIIKTNYFNPDKKYLWAENDIIFPYPYNPKTLYSFSNKMKRYFSREPWLEVYSENKTYDNSRFYLKIYMFYSWLVLGLLILASYLLTFKRKH